MNYFTVDSISIIERHGILEGKAVQLAAVLSPDSASKNAVEWSSSNPNVITCTPEGIIKGVSAGDYAIITCKSKYGDVSDSIKVYCVKPIGNPIESEFVNPITIIYKQPSTGSIASFHYSVSFFYRMFIRAFTEIILPALGMLNFSMAKPNDSASSSLITAGECTVYGKQGSYAYIEIINKHTTIDGFVRYTRLDKEINSFLNLSATNIDVWADGISDSSKKLTTSYKGEVEWKVGDESIISFDDKTFQITGLKPGTTTITATADGMSKTCTVHSIYKWPQSWVATTNSNTDLYEADGNGYKKSKVISEGQTFTVYGDDGSSDGWAYGKTTIAGAVKWGFVPISHISTKGTISQYRKFGWSWPVVTPENKNKANFISSPYGERDTNPTMHKGFDITTGVPGEIECYDVISAFSGKVIYIGDSKSTGHCVGIQSEKTDPISGEKMVAFYMHLNETPSVEHGQKIDQGEPLGRVGNTGNSGGYHLHFEVNNKNASIGDGSTARNYYAYLINPLFFFTDHTNNYVIGVESDKRKAGNENKIIIDKTCSTVVSHFGAYWYGDDKQEK